jgi:hypothetical protein
LGEVREEYDQKIMALRNGWEIDQGNLAAQKEKEIRKLLRQVF